MPEILTDKEKAIVFSKYNKVEDSFGQVFEYYGYNGKYAIVGDSENKNVLLHSIHSFKALVIPLEKISDIHLQSIAAIIQLKKDSWFSQNTEFKTSTEYVRNILMDKHSAYFGSSSLLVLVYKFLDFHQYDTHNNYFGVTHWATGKTAIQLGIGKALF